MDKKLEMLALLQADTQVQDFIQLKQRLDGINNQIDSLKEQKQEIINQIKGVEDTVKTKIAEVFDGKVAVVESPVTPIEETIN